MNETPDDLAALQRALDASHASAGAHLRSIFTTERRLDAAQVAERLSGVFLLNVATVTRDGAPLVAPVDGCFLRGRVFFGLPPGSVRARHLRARPRVSATVTRGDAICLVVHGTAREVAPGSPEHAAYAAYVRALYGPLVELSERRYAERAGSAYDAWIEPRRIFAMRPGAE